MEINEDILVIAEERLRIIEGNQQKQRQYDKYEEACLKGNTCPSCGRELKGEFKSSFIAYSRTEWDCKNCRFIKIKIHDTDP